jgi:hypothetical protein
MWASSSTMRTVGGMGWEGGGSNGWGGFVGGAGEVFEEEQDGTIVGGGTIAMGGGGEGGAAGEGGFGVEVMEGGIAKDIEEGLGADGHAVFVGGFGETIGVEEHSGAFGEDAAFLEEAEVGVDAEGGAGGEDLFRGMMGTDDEQGGMAGASDAEFAGLEVNVGDLGGDDHVEAAQFLDEIVIQPFDEGAGAAGEVGSGMEEGTEDHGEEGGGEAFAHDISDGQEEAVGTDAEDVVEIAGHAFGAFAEALGDPATATGVMPGQQLALDMGGHFEVAFEQLGLETGAVVFGVAELEGEEVAEGMDDIDLGSGEGVGAGVAADGEDTDQFSGNEEGMGQAGEGWGESMEGIGGVGSEGSIEPDIVTVEGGGDLKGSGDAIAWTEGERG